MVDGPKPNEMIRPVLLVGLKSTFCCVEYRAMLLHGSVKWDPCLCVVHILENGDD